LINDGLTSLRYLPAPCAGSRRLFAAAALAFAALLPGVAAAQQAERNKEAILLVASPDMLDPRFAQTVVLVTFPPDTGPMGVVLNRPSKVELRELWPERADRQERTDPICYGGPVEPNGLLFVFRMSPPPTRAAWVTEDIYFSGDGKVLDKLLEQRRPVRGQRFFAGFAGWAPGQLEQEIDDGGWYVLPVDPEVIFNMPAEDMWDRLLERATLPRASIDTRS